MALGFFRKRQKMIFVIMVVLMVSFLIGYQGFSMLFQKNPVKTVLGEARDFKITLGTLRESSSDLQTLQFLGRGFGRHTLQGAAFEAMYYNAPTEKDRSLLYTLLLKQAGEDDYAVTEPEVDSLIQQMKTNGLDFDAYALHLRQNQGVPVKELRGVLARWLLICKACQADQIVVPPSREQLVQLFRDAVEKINLQIVTIPAENFTQGVADPTDEQINELFDTYKNRPAGTFAGLDAFSFGYLSPARVKLSYLFISQNAILRSCIPGDREIADYIQANDASLTKTEGEGDKAKTVPMSNAEKRAAAVDALQPELAQAKFTRIVERIRQLTSVTVQVDATPEAAFAAAAAKLTLPADDLLARKVPVLACDKQPLDQAVDMLAQAASPRISAICFPYGQGGKVKIAPDLKITLSLRDVTVGEALAKIAEQIPDMPKLTWGMCEGVDNVLFPVDGVRLFPVTAGETAPATQEQINDDPLLGMCFSQQPPATLGQLAMQVNVIEPKSQFTIDQDGPPLRVWDPDNGGVILWRVVAAEAPKSPESLTDDIRGQIVHDWKLQQAFPKAVARAEEMKNAADLAAYVKAEKAKTTDTGMFARKSQRKTEGVFLLQPTRLAVMEFLSPAIDGEVIQQAFAALTPKDLAADYSKESDNVLILPLPPEGYVLAARRIDFEPAEKKTFEESKAALIQFMNQQQTEQGILLWFNLENVKKRTGYVEKEHAAE